MQPRDEDCDMKRLKLSVPASVRPTDPLELFNKLTLRGDVKNIWDSQADALRVWHKTRTTSDLVVEMGTGGGKTLVGLLIAQSLVNETRGRILYLCATNQLAEQTLQRAESISLAPSTRLRGTWSAQEGFDAGNTFCITNYASLLNGRSVFRNDPPDAIVFDDAHVAENEIRNRFTVRLPTQSEAVKQILTRLNSYFLSSSQASQFEDAKSGSPTSPLFIPMFLVAQHADLIRRAMLDNGVADNQETLFAWEHIKNHIAQCSILLNGERLEMSPAIPPMWTFSWMAKDVRKVYLTATVPTPSAFVRTFGLIDPKVIRPSGRSGDPQRLFVFAEGDSDEEQRDRAIELATGAKSCVISPSWPQGRQWEPTATLYATDSGNNEIDRFAQSSKPEMLGLVARYDGIDLPGDACRILILDRVPKGEHLIDRFIDESVKVDTIRLAHTATRIVQAIGRIFRGSTDHGVVIAVGIELQSWLRRPSNRAYIPEILQQQILLGIELAEKVQERETNWNELMSGVLEGESEWNELYRDYVGQFEVHPTQDVAPWLTELLMKEREAYQHLWAGHADVAADAYSELTESAAMYDFRLAAWYEHWCGASLLLANRRPEALTRFIHAANVRSELGRPASEDAFSPPKSCAPGSQAKQLAERLRRNRSVVIRDLAAVKGLLVYGHETSKAEEGLKLLGSALGLDSTRPDKSKAKTGPDVLWRLGGTVPGWGFELKTDKEAGGEYAKKDIGQCHDHEQWLVNKVGADHELAIVGRILPVSALGNPSPRLRVIPLEGFTALRDRLRRVVDVVNGGTSNLEQRIQDWLEYEGLIFPDCVDSLEWQHAERLVGAISDHSN